MDFGGYESAFGGPKTSLRTMARRMAAGSVRSARRDSSMAPAAGRETTAGALEAVWGFKTISGMATAGAGAAVFIDAGAG